MKFLKFLLGLVIVLILGAIGLVFFSNNIVSNITKTNNSEFVNLKYSIRDGEFDFENFVLNGKKLGKGKAKLHIERSGFLGLIPKTKLSNLVLNDVDLTTIYNAPNKQIDAFMEKIDIPITNEISKKTTESYITESTKKIENISKETDNFVNEKIKTNLENINKIKSEYISSTDLKVKSQKLLDLNKEIKALNDLINVEKKNIEKSILEIENDKTLMIENMSDNLVSLEKTASLSQAQNISSYVFLDKGKNIVNSLNKSLKATSLMKEIKDLSIEITDFSINNDEIKFSNLRDNNNIKGQVEIDKNSSNAIISGKNGDYEIALEEKDLKIKTLFGKIINSLIEYDKTNLLDGKTVKLITELVFDNNLLKENDKTVLTEDEKKLLVEKISNIKTVQYEEVTKKYEEQLAVLDNLIKQANEKKSVLDKLQNDLMTLQSGNETIPTPENQEQTENKTTEQQAAEGTTTTKTAPVQNTEQPQQPTTPATGTKN